MWATNSSGWDDRGADLQCLVCRVVPGENETAQDPSADPADAIMILLVTRATIASNKPDSYEIISHPEFTGLTAVSGPHVRFTRFHVPAHNLLAAPGKGAPIITNAFNSSTALAAAMSVGIMRATFDAALKFAKEDTRGGAVPILERQSVADLLMNIKMRTDAARFLTWKACTALQASQGLELALEAKLFASDNAVRCVADAMQAVGV